MNNASSLNLTNRVIFRDVKGIIAADNGAVTASEQTWLRAKVWPMLDALQNGEATIDTGLERISELLDAKSTGPRQYDLLLAYAMAALAHLPADSERCPGPQRDSYDRCYTFLTSLSARSRAMMPRG